jgi:putative DNA-invertase from lambdoid prophage Rac
VLVVRWVDRLGRDYEDVCDVIREFMRRGVVIRTIVRDFTFDGLTKDPMKCWGSKRWVSRKSPDTRS